MEIRIDERLVDVFNEAVEKDMKYFHGETNLEKFINSQLADYLCYIDKKNDNEFLSEEASDKLLDFLIEDIEDDEMRQGLGLLAKIVKVAAGK